MIMPITTNTTTATCVQIQNGDIAINSLGGIGERRSASLAYDRGKPGGSRMHLRQSIRSTVIRLGREEQARNLLRRVREARSTIDGDLRRNLRDDHAMEIIMATLLRADSNAIDVGANEGMVLEAITRIAPAGEHMAWEPVPELCEDLVSRFPQVEVRQAALFDTAGTASFTHVLDVASRSGLRQRTDLDVSPDRLREISVRTERLDDVLAPDYTPTLIKIDVEGAELGVMRGAVDTLHRHRPFVLFEHGIGGADLYDAHPAEVFDLLDGAAMRIFDLDGQGPYSREQFESTFTEPIWNFLAAPG
jgi:FkbM family methyltransferase